jgi:hypothetical protein
MAGLTRPSRAATDGRDTPGHPLRHRAGQDGRIKSGHDVARTEVTARRLDTIPGFGPILSSATAAIVTDPRHFDSGRDFAASLGLVPRQSGTGGTVKLGPISKRGNGYWSLSSGWPLARPVGRLLVIGATAVLNGKNARNAIRGGPKCSMASPENWPPWPPLSQGQAPWPTRWRASPGR